MTRTSAGPARAQRVALPLCHNGLGLGTGVLTADGELPVEYLTPGDRIVTFDLGLVRLDRIEVRQVPARDSVRIRPAAIDPAGGGGDVIVSARQQILVRDWRARILWNRPVALVEARQLVDHDHVSRLEGAKPVRLFRLVFKDRQHLVDVAGGRLQLASARLPARVPG